MDKSQLRRILYQKGCTIDEVESIIKSVLPEAILMQVEFVTGIVWQCSNCHRTFVLSNPQLEGYNYCPVCGARFVEYAYLEDE
jgi:rRNA maturation endonuclease Nob1